MRQETFRYDPPALGEQLTPPGDVDAFIEKAQPSLDLEESWALQAMLAWINLSDEVLKEVFTDAVYAQRSTMAFAELPTTPAPNGHARGQDRVRVPRG